MATFSCSTFPTSLLPFVEPFLTKETSPGSLGAAGFFYGISIIGVRKAANSMGLSERQVMQCCLEHDIWPLRFKNNRGIFSAAQQAFLLQRHVVVLGCGGLGGHVLDMLARLGIGVLTACDDDTFDESNLNRQRFSREDRLGMLKAVAAQDELHHIASHATVHAMTEHLTSANFPQLFTTVHAVMDCLDSLPLRLAAEKAAHAAGIPFIHGALSGLEGFAMASAPAEAGNSGLFQMYGATPPEKKDGAERVAGVPTITPAAVAVLQVALLLQTLLRAHGGSKKENASAATQQELWHIDLAVPELARLLL